MTLIPHTIYDVDDGLNYAHFEKEIPREEIIDHFGVGMIETFERRIIDDELQGLNRNNLNYQFEVVYYCEDGDWHRWYCNGYNGFYTFYGIIISLIEIPNRPSKTKNIKKLFRRSSK